MEGDTINLYEAITWSEIRPPANVLHQIGEQKSHRRRKPELLFRVSAKGKWKPYR